VTYQWPGYDTWLQSGTSSPRSSEGTLAGPVAELGVVQQWFARRMVGSNKIDSYYFLKKTDDR